MQLFFSDIHANRTAARHIERVAASYDRLIFAGDLCGYGDDWAYIIDQFIDLEVKAVLGNHDLMVLDESVCLESYPERVSEPIRRTRSKLTGRHRDYLKQLPMQLELDGGVFIRHTVGIDTYCHEPADCMPLLEMTDAPVIVIGHTHIQRCYEIAGRTIVNPGSVSHGRKGHPPGYATCDNGKIQFHTMAALA